MRVRELECGGVSFEMYIMSAKLCFSLLVFKWILTTSGENLKLISLETKYNSAFLPALSCVNGGSVYARRAKRERKVRRLT